MRFYIIFFLLIGCFGFLTNPFLDTAGTDSSIFLYVARLFNEGGVPYRDVFDQKGPFIFLIDAIGLKIGGNSFLGIWLFDCLAYLGAVFLSFRLCCRYVEPKTAVFVIAPFAAIYHLFACGGNMPEMYIIVFALVAYHICLNAKETWSVGDCLAMGACVGAILMLKLNMITVIVPIGICWLYRKNKIKHFLLMLVGLFLATTPFLMYLWINQALSAFWEVYIEYNGQYARHYKFLPVVNRGCIVMAGLFAVNVWQCFDKTISDNNKFLLRLNLAYFAVAWYAVVLSGGTYRYYGPIIPACVLPMSFLFSRVKRLSYVIAVTSICLLLGIVAQRNICYKAADRIAALNQLNGFIKDKDSLTVLGCDCLVYLLLDARSPSRFPYQGTIANTSQFYRELILEDIKSKKSKYLIVPDNMLENDGVLGMAWSKATVLANYVLIANSGKYALYHKINQ